MAVYVGSSRGAFILFGCVYGRGEGEEEGKVTYDVLRFNFVLFSEKFANILSAATAGQAVSCEIPGGGSRGRELEQRIMGYRGREGEGKRVVGYRGRERVSGL
jgi:hypothetical protein